MHAPMTPKTAKDADPRADEQDHERPSLPVRRAPLELDEHQFAGHLPCGSQYRGCLAGRAESATPTAGPPGTVMVQTQFDLGG